MPIISYFFGIVIKMYFDDHNPPHFHAEYQGREGLFHINDGRCFEGDLPDKAVKIISEWAISRKSELMRDWELAQGHQPLEKIKGADND
ncbi:MAG: DUF4160 domain-containing protein [Nitrospirae bacterium]|nr:DUF4160 domain-containing protein [Nitrospirota bacterium]